MLVGLNAAPLIDVIPCGFNVPTIMRRSFVNIFSVTLLLTAFLNVQAQRVVPGKMLKDGSGEFAQDVTAMIASDDVTVAKVNAIEPFVLGFYGFKALRIVNLGVGAADAAQLNICRLVIGIWDKEIDGVLAAINAKPKSVFDFYFPTEDETKAVQRFVVVKQMTRWYSFLDPNDDGALPPENDPISKWQHSFGMTLGETAADRKSVV